MHFKDVPPIELIAQMIFWSGHCSRKQVEAALSVSAKTAARYLEDAECAYRDCVRRVGHNLLPKEDAPPPEAASEERLYQYMGCPPLHSRHHAELPASPHPALPNTVLAARGYPFNSRSPSRGFILETVRIMHRHASEPRARKRGLSLRYVSTKVGGEDEIIECIPVALIAPDSQNPLRLRVREVKKSTAMRTIDVWRVVSHKPYTDTFSHGAKARHDGLTTRYNFTLHNGYSQHQLKCLSSYLDLRDQELPKNSDLTGNIFKQRELPPWQKDVFKSLVQTSSMSSENNHASPHWGLESHPFARMSEA